MADTTTSTSSSSPYNALIAANMAAQPNPLVTASQALSVQNQQVQNQQQQVSLDDATLANAQNHIAFKSAALAPLLGLGDNVTMGDVSKAASAAVANSKGAISPQEMGQWISNLPPDPPADPSNPNAPPAGNPALHKALLNGQLQLTSAQDRVATMRGQQGTLNVGGTTYFITRNGLDGTPQIQGGVANTMDPASAASPQPGPINKLTGGQTMRPAGAAAEAAGLAPVGTYTGPGGGPSTAAPTQVMLDRSGRIARVPAPSSAPPAQAPAGPGSGAPSGTFDTSLGPGTQAAYKASGDQYAGALQNAGTYAQQMQQLQSALTGLQSTNTGPGTESRQAIASYMLALPGGIGNYLPGVDPKSIAAYDEANKYLTQSASGTPNAARSDAGLNTALASSPSVHISNTAAQDVVKANVGFRRAEMASINAFKKTGQPDEQFSNFLSDRQQQIDPRAYSADMLSPPQRAAFMATLDKDAKAKFLFTVRDGMANHVISPNAFAAGAATQAGGAYGGQ